MVALLSRKLQKNPLPFGILETLTIAFKESMRPALAANAEHEGFAVVNHLQKLLSP